jgi:hypothetical protein
MSSAKDPSANGRLRSNAPAGHFPRYLFAQPALRLGSALDAATHAHAVHDDPIAMGVSYDNGPIRSGAAGAVGAPRTDHGVGFGKIDGERRRKTQ